MQSSTNKFPIKMYSKHSSKQNDFLKLRVVIFETNVDLMLKTHTQKDKLVETFTRMENV